MRGDPVKNQRKKPQRNLSCKETQKHRYITRGRIHAYNSSSLYQLIDKAR